MKKVFVLIFFILWVVIGCVGPSKNLKQDRVVVGDVLKFSMDVVSLGLLLSGQGSHAHLPSASLATVLDSGKAIDAIIQSKGGKDGWFKEIDAY